MEDDSGLLASCVYSTSPNIVAITTLRASGRGPHINPCDVDTCISTREREHAHTYTSSGECSRLHNTVDAVDFLHARVHGTDRHVVLHVLVFEREL
jgi:hypothetical protein